MLPNIRGLWAFIWVFVCRTHVRIFQYTNIPDPSQKTIGKPFDLSLNFGANPFAAHFFASVVKSGGCGENLNKPPAAAASALIRANPHPNRS
jgi:hypothetical protein